jgi:hypothetical protein
MFYRKNIKIIKTGIYLYRICTYYCEVQIENKQDWHEKLNHYWKWHGRI